MILLETKRLVVKSISMDNLKEINELYSDPEVMFYEGVRNCEETRVFVNKMIEHHKKHNFSSGNVYEKETDLFIGRSGLVFLEMDDTQPEIELGYILHQKFWGKGYATELSMAFLEWGFKNLSVPKLVGIVRLENFKSRRVLEKIGMNYVGNIKSWGEESAKYEISKEQFNKKTLEP